MKKEVRERFQEIILEAVKRLPIHPRVGYSDTTLIVETLIDRYRRELEELGIDTKCEHGPLFSFERTVLRQLNNLHKMGRVTKRVLSSEESGTNFTLIRWRWKMTR